MSVARPFLRTAVVTVALLAAPLTGCGSEEKASSGSPKSPTPGFADKSGEEVLNAAMAAMNDVKAVHIKGSVIIDEGRLLLDVSRDKVGTCAGTMTQAGATVRFVATGHGDFLKGDEKFWRDNGGKGADQLIKMLGGKWAKLPNDDELDGLCDISQLLAHSKGGFSGAPKGRPISFADRDAVEITAKEGDEAYRLVVGTDKPHYLLRLVSETKDDDGDLQFSEFGEVTTIHVPASSESVAVGG